MEQMPKKCMGSWGREAENGGGPQNCFGCTTIPIDSHSHQFVTHINAYRVRIAARERIHYGTDHTQIKWERLSFRIFCWCFYSSSTCSPRLLLGSGLLVGNDCLHRKLPTNEFQCLMHNVYRSHSSFACVSICIITAFGSWFIITWNRCISILMESSMETFQTETIRISCSSFGKRDISIISYFHFTTNS